MAEIENFIRLLERAAKTMKHAANLPAIIAQNLKRIVPGIALMNHDVESQLDRKIEELLK